MHINSFQKTVDLLHRALDVNALRYTVSANNLANSEIPDFKRTSVNFETELKHALDSEKRAAGQFQLAVTDPRHIKSDGVIDYRSVSPRRVLDYMTTAKDSDAVSTVESDDRFSVQPSTVGIEIRSSKWVSSAV